MTQHFQHALVAVGAIVTFAYGQLLPHLFAGRMPQVPGENVVAMLLAMRGRRSVSPCSKGRRLFSAGVRHAECDHSLSSASQKESEHHSPTEGRHAHAHGHDHDHDHHEHDAASAPLDPWRWINRRVHVQDIATPKAKTHANWCLGSGPHAVSPRNIQAYESSAYVLSHMLERPHDALALLEEGVRLNPTSAELEFSLGQLALHSLKDSARAERAFAAAHAKCKPEPGEAGEDARFLQGRILFYLGYLAHQRGDHVQAESYLDEAIKEVPQHAGTRDLRKLLNRQDEDKEKNHDETDVDMGGRPLATWSWVSGCIHAQIGNMH